MRYIFDTSIWVALFLKNDTHHDEALALWRALDGQVVLPYIVVAETASVLTYKHSKRQADKFLQFISKSPCLVPYQNQLRPESDFFIRFSRRLSFADYAVLFAAQTENCPLVTFDKQMRSMFRGMGDK